jgi:transcriptional regulator with XRE-family HTH domain
MAIVGSSMIDKDELVRRRREARLSQPELADRVGCSQQLIAALETGMTRSTKFLPRIAGALGAEPGQLDPDYAHAGRFASVPPLSPAMAERDFPIYASVEHGRGQMILSTDPVDYMRRPWPVIRVNDAYGLYVAGESMVPEYRPGDIAIVNPHLPVVADEVYIFYGRDGRSKATIKHLSRALVDTWHVRQWNPPEGSDKDFILSREEWPICHRVLGKYSR